MNGLAGLGEQILNDAGDLLVHILRVACWCKLVTTCDAANQNSDQPYCRWQDSGALTVSLGAVHLLRKRNQGWLRVTGGTIE